MPDKPKSGDDAGSPEKVFSGLKVRGIGPALMSGRIGDFAVNPKNPREYYVAVASGGVAKRPLRFPRAALMIASGPAGITTYG